MAKIGIFDSGVGGLSVMKEILKVLPESSYIYFGDNANCPYGIKGPEFIVSRSRYITKFLLSRNVDVVVVACNTATSYAVETLRNEFSIPIIGTVPGVKPMAAETKTGIVGVLATFGTLNAPLYNRIRDKWGANVIVLEHIGQGFVELVESLELTGPKAEKIVRESIEPMICKGADKLVLGCTHYPFLRDTILKAANEIKPITIPEIDVYDSAPAIARHLLTIIQENNIPVYENNPQIELIASGSDDVLKKLYSLI